MHFPFVQLRLVTVHSLGLGLLFVFSQARNSQSYSLGRAFWDSMLVAHQFEVPIIRDIKYWGLYWVPPILGNYHLVWEVCSLSSRSHASLQLAAAGQHRMPPKYITGCGREWRAILYIGMRFRLVPASPTNPQ